MYAPETATSSASSLWQKMRAPGSPLAPATARPAQLRVDVHVPVGDHLRAGVDGREHDQVVALRVDDLAAAHRLAYDDRPARRPA